MFLLKMFLVFLVGSAGLTFSIINIGHVMFRSILCSVIRDPFPILQS